MIFLNLMNIGFHFFETLSGDAVIWQPLVHLKHQKSITTLSLQRLPSYQPLLLFQN